jgi:hypothetical protein
VERPGEQGKSGQRRHGRNGGWEIGGAQKLEEHRREQGQHKAGGGQGAGDLMHVERACRNSDWQAREE